MRITSLNPKDFAQDIWREKALRALDSKSLADPNDDYVLHRYVRGIRHHNAELGLLEKKIAGHASASGDARILMSMTGIDYYAAMLLASEIDGIGRFASPKKLVSWAGMCPTVHGPPVGQHDVPRTDEEGFEQDSVCRQVNWVLIQAAHVAVLYDGRMRDYYERMKKTHHSSIAITHVANKMIKIIWHMLASRDLYRDRNEKLYQKKLKRIDAAV